MSEITETWFEEAKKLSVGEAIYLRAADRKEQKSISDELEKEREQFSEIDSVHASQIFINRVTRDLKLYVILERKYRAPFTAFFKDSEGKFSKISVDPERKRMIQLMLKEKKAFLEIEETLNGLTDDELKEFFPDRILQN